MRRFHAVTLPILLALAFSMMARIPSAARADDADAPPGGASPAKTGEKSPGAKATRARGEDARRRWESLPEKRRVELERIHRRLQELDPAERKILMEKLRSMEPKERRDAIRRAGEKAKERVDGAAPKKARKDLLRERLEKLPPAVRRRLLDASPAEIRAYLSERRKATLSKLPPDARARAESLPPREQAEFLRRFRGEQIFRETFRDPGEVKAIRNLAPREAAEALGIGRDGAGADRPAFLSEETWTRWNSLRPFEKPRVLRHILQGRNGEAEGSDTPQPRGKAERKQP